MDQIHKRFTVEQVKILFQSYLQGTIARSELEEILQINKSRFFALLREYRHDPAVSQSRTKEKHLLGYQQKQKQRTPLNYCGRKP
jgi:hypothetical protein